MKLKNRRSKINQAGKFWAAITKRCCGKAATEVSDSARIQKEVAKTPRGFGVLLLWKSWRAGGRLQAHQKQEWAESVVPAAGSTRIERRGD